MKRASKHREDLKTFKFRLANVFLHEIGGHLFMTYLGYGGMRTPPSITGHYHFSGECAEFGESGRRVEKDLFGGNVVFCRLVGDDDSQVHYRL